MAFSCRIAIIDSEMSIMLPVLIFLAWLAFLVMPAGKLAIEDAQNPSLIKRRGVSIFPGIPLLPLVMWSGSILLAHFLSPLVLLISLSLHGLLLLVCGFLIVRNILAVRSAEGAGDKS